MEYIIAIAVILIVAGLIALFVYRSSRWRPLAEANSLTEEISHKYDYLQKEGVRCRIKHLSANASSGVAAGGVGRRVRLEVHKNDWEKCQQKLESYHFSPGLKI